jgi:pimeloyl-ACP methyl ester carboxylesterase
MGRRMDGELRHRTSIGGLEIAERRWGSAGRAVVLVHGLGVSSSYWRRLGPVLGRSARVFAPDLPGFGRSSRPSRPFGIAALTDALTDWQDEAAVGPAALVANSLGCQIAVEAAVRRPDLAEALVLLGPTVDTQAARFLPQLGRLLLDATREPLALSGLVVGEYARVGPRRVVETFRDALAHPLVERAAQVGVPALVTRGEHDPIAPRRWVEELAARLPQGSAAVVPGAAHAAHWSRPEAFGALVAGFLGRAL